MNIKTWANGFGVWHATVPMSDSTATDAARARRAIRSELVARDEVGQGYRVRVVLDSINGDTVTYREA